MIKDEIKKVKEREKKPYSAPDVTKFGLIEEMTGDIPTS
jgi:hypothetical protein